MKLFLHIGTEKTGSSFLQTLLALNREQLKASKIYYPNAGKREEDMISGKISPGNGKDLYIALQRDNQERVRSMLSEYKVKAQRSGCEVILLSNENLIELLSQKKLFNQFIKQCLESEIEWTDLLLVLRDPVGQALSLYKHRAKNGKAAPLKNWLENGYNLPTCLNDFLAIEEYKKVKITIRKYQKDALAMQKIMFNDWLQIGNPKNIPLQERVNPSLTISELLLLKKIAHVNEKWAVPFYEKMLELPLIDKDKEHELSNYYKKLITQKLVTFNNVWEKCNENLSANEKLTLPVEHKIQDDEGETLSFTLKQTEQIVNFLLEVRTEQVVLKAWLKKIKRKLNL